MCCVDNALDSVLPVANALESKPYIDIALDNG